MKNSTMKLQELSSEQMLEVTGGKKSKHKKSKSSGSNSHSRSKSKSKSNSGGGGQDWRDRLPV